MNKTLFLLSLLITPVAYSQEPKDMMKKIVGLTLETAQIVWVVVFILVVGMFIATFMFARQNKVLLFLLGFLSIIALMIRFTVLKG